MAASTVIDILEGTTAEALNLRHQFVTTVRADETIRTGFEQLIINDIYAAPVYDNESKQFVGTLDLVDLAALVTKTFAEYGPYQQKTPLTKTDIHTLADRFYDHKVKDVLNASGRNPFSPVPPTATVLKVTQLLVSAAHRVPVVDASNQVTNVLSQARVIQFLSKHLDKLGDEKDKTVKDLHLGYGTVLTVESNVTTIEAFERMAKHKYSSAAIVDHHGALHGNISIKDLKGILTDFSRLLLPVEEYINIIRRQNLRDIFPSIHCYESYTLSKVIQKFTATGVHRLYLLSDDSKQLIGVISLEDLLKQILHIYNRKQ